MPTISGLYLGFAEHCPPYRILFLGKYSEVCARIRLTLASHTRLYLSLTSPKR